MKEIVASVLGLFLGGAVFGVLCFVFDAPTFEHAAFAIMVGAFTGLLAAPEFAPESFRYPKGFQMLAGTGVGLGIGALFGASLPYILGLSLIGAAIGYFAKQFIELIPIP
ncbi:MAG: hypothetical protein CME36_12060 [unclassified Hahellaceae]|nr:hypothetical protein [Hahellaceae bacterium]|tara:strand:+ start:3068 stop:3397 length:330 start_codon:yes stop_codon:yes gene_type:complete